MKVSSVLTLSLGLFLLPVVAHAQECSADSKSASCVSFAVGGNAPVQHSSTGSSIDACRSDLLEMLHSADLAERQAKILIAQIDLFKRAYFDSHRDNSASADATSTISEGVDDAMSEYADNITQYSILAESQCEIDLSEVRNKSGWIEGHGDYVRINGTLTQTVRNGDSDDVSDYLDGLHESTEAQVTLSKEIQKILKVLLAKKM